MEYKVAVSHRFKINDRDAVLNLYFDMTDEGKSTWPLYDVTVNDVALGKRRLVPVPWNYDILFDDARHEYGHMLT